MSCSAPRPAAAAARAARCTSGTWTRAWCPGIAIVGGRHPARGGDGAGVQDAEAPGVVACFFGDGAVAEGAFHEGVNMAAIWDLPVLFVCENNLYGASTRVDQVMRNPRDLRPRPPPTASGARRSTATTCWPSTRRPGRPPPNAAPAKGPVLLELLDLSAHRPLPPRPLPLSAEGGTRGMVAAIRSTASADLLEGMGSGRPGASWTRSAARSRRPRFQDAVEAGAAPADCRQLDDLTTDVFA